MHFNRYVSYWSHRAPASNALWFQGRFLTWGELDTASQALASYLAEIGVKPGDRFGCLLPNCLEWVVSFVAAIRLGAIFVPVNALFGEYEVRQIVENAGLSALFSRNELVRKLGWADDAPDDTIHVFDCRGGRPPARFADLATSGRTFADEWRSDEEPMILCYTSGTTGLPKGIVLTHRVVDTYSNSMQLCFDWRPGQERQLVLAPLAFTGTVICVIAHMIRTGACAYIEARADPARALDILVDEKITYFSGVPAILGPITQLPGFAEADLSHLSTCYTGGAPVPQQLLEAYLSKGVTVRQQYATSETSGGICCPTEELARHHPESAGHPLASLDLEIRDPQGRTLPYGEVGEICVRGAILMREYWDNPHATAEAITDGWYRTGDMGRYDPVIGLVVADRKKNMLISAGVNVYPAEVERAIATIPGVVEVAVIGVPHPRWGDEVVALVHAPTLGDIAALAEAARTLLGKFKTPRRFAFAPDPLPRTVTNKIQRKGLDALFARLTEQDAPTENAVA